MKQDKTIKVAVNITVRGMRNERCGERCPFLWDDWPGASCDAFTENGGTTPLERSRLLGVFMRCQACLDSEMKA